jgi:superfamily I DNA/RNA helicase
LLPTPSQREAIEAALGPALVLAGPGAGKTFCLIERIRYLITNLGVNPARICAFTFTNKAAEEIGTRLDNLGAAAQLVKRGTIHAFCADLLRVHGHHEGLERGFGIADEHYQRAILARLRQPAKLHTSILASFTLHRLKDRDLSERDARVFVDYVKRLERRNMADFDMLVVKAAHLLLTVPAVADEARAAWDYILVDEFQDLNQRQYEVVKSLACQHQNVFAVGDDEQSIFSWTGADNTLFGVLKNDFAIVKPITLRDNHRCPRQVFELAKSLVRRNPPGAWVKEDIVATRESDHPVRAFNFDDEVTEGDWLLDDLVNDRTSNALRWGDYAVLYRRHEIGDALEASLIGAGVPCRLAQGRAVSDDPVVAYLVAALKVIADPANDVFQEEFLKVVLPPSLMDILRTRVERVGEGGTEGGGLRGEMEAHARTLGRRNPNASKLWRALFALRNLESLGRKHESLVALVQELLSQRVGVYRTMLEDRDDLSDPADFPDVVTLSNRLAGALDSGTMVWVEPMRGLEIPLRALLQGVGFTRFGVGAVCPEEAEPTRATDTPSFGIALGLFKALQLVATRRGEVAFKDFTAVDIETTDKDVEKAEVIDLAAVRVRDGRVVAEWSSLVKPRVPIHAAVKALTGISDEDVADQPHFEQVWEAFREFCGKDVLIAHNGYHFDFPILERMSGGHVFLTYDTLVLARELHPGSRRLTDLAAHFRIPTGQSHRALDDSQTLAQVFLKLDEERLVRSRKTALANLLDQLGIALSIDETGTRSPQALEVAALREATSYYALGRYSDALEQYRVQRELAGDPSLPHLDEIIDRLGGKKRMERLRTERTADDRYPQAMARLRRLLQRCDSPLLDGQIAQFLELVALSRQDGSEVSKDRVSLLTLHSTKGLEFSRVYVVGVEDSELPGGSRDRPAGKLDIEEGRRLLYVGMTRAKERLVLTRAAKRGDLPTGGIQFLAEMGLKPENINGGG